MVSIRQMQWEHCLPEAIRRAHARIDTACLRYDTGADAELDAALIALDDLLKNRVHACELIHPGVSVSFW